MCFYSWSKLVSIYNVSILVLLLWQFWFCESVNLSPSLCRCVFSDLNLHIILYTHVNFGSIVCSNFGFSESVNLSGVAVRPRKKSKHCCYQALLTQFPLSNQVSFRKKQFESLFFLSISSRYSCRICSYMHAHPPNTRTPHNTPHVQTNLQLHSDVRSRNRVHLEITGRFRRRRARHNPFMAPHVRGCRLQLEIVKGNYCSRVRHQRRNQASNAGGQVAHQRS